MLEKLNLDNFKGFEKIEIPFKPVTLLGGLNSAGKSSVLHAILLLKQIDLQIESDQKNLELFPNGRFVSLGTGREILHEFAKSDYLSISWVTDNGKKNGLKFKYIESSKQLLCAASGSRSKLATIRNMNISYLSAERWGPRVAYPYEGSDSSDELGTHGEYAIRYLIDHANDVVENDKVRHLEAKSNTLVNQVQAWLGEISPGVKLDVKALGETGSAVAGFGFERKSDVASRYYRPTHVGFGLSYSLPLLIALLSAKPGSIVLLENPEAHLHPRGQAQLARLISLASHKVQVILETHSDHVMNGLRVAVRNKDLPKENVVFNYFSREGVNCVVDSPRLDDNGRLSHWPQGFFDEHEKLLAALVRRQKV